METTATISQGPKEKVNVDTTLDPGREHTPEVVVIFTGVRQTLEALRMAASLAQDLHAIIHLVVPQIVPFPLPLDQPPVRRDFIERRFRTLVPNGSIPTWVDVRLCRERPAIRSLLAPKSLVVIGRRNRWPWWGDSGLVKSLKAEGHHVFVCERERSTCV